MKPLSNNFQPGPSDAICARGKISLRHEGNKKFRELIEINLDAYSNTKTKAARSEVVSSIVSEIRFVKNIDGRWHEVGERLAREKTGHGLRELLHNKYRSSHKSKKRRWKQDRSNFECQVHDFVQKNCKDIFSKLQNISLSEEAKSDDELQDMFNEAQSKLLQALKSHVVVDEQDSSGNSSQVSINRKMEQNTENRKIEKNKEPLQKKRRCTNSGRSIKVSVGNILTELEERVRKRRRTDPELMIKVSDTVVSMCTPPPREIFSTMHRCITPNAA